MSGFGNLQPGYVEPIGNIHPKLGTHGERVARRIALHEEALDKAFETEPCSACCGTGSGIGFDLCTTCWGTRSVPLTEEQWRSDLCDEFSAGIQAAIDDLTKSLASHNQQLYPDEAMVQLAQRAQQAAENAAKAWRSSPDRRVVMQAVQQAGGR